MMADLSDDINDLKKYYTLMEENNEYTEVLVGSLIIFKSYWVPKTKVNIK